MRSVVHMSGNLSTQFINDLRHTQDRNQLDTPEEAKSFLRGAQNFSAKSNSFKVCPTHFSRGVQIMRGAKRHP